MDDLLEAVLSLAENKRLSASRDFDERDHHELARRGAAESTVLLKNEGQLLPLKPGARVAVVGDFAFEPRYQGAGSSMVNATKTETIVEETAHYHLQVIGSARGYERTGGENETLFTEAVSLAKTADVVLYFFGLDELSESEGMDRTHMKIPQNQIRLLEELFKVNPKVVGILSAGSAVEMSWEPCCKAILHGYLSGQAGAGAMLDLLTGRKTPCGKLNETYPVSYEDTPSCHYFPGKERNSEYREGIYIGYRYYETAGVKVRYPFGYGLSYTTFQYSDLQTGKNGISFAVTNSGSFDGAEIVQMYVALPKSRIFRPKKELKGFQKVFLKAGETKKVTIPFDDKTFRYWNVKTGKWETEKGAYQILVGGSSEDIRLLGEISLEGSGAPEPYEEERLRAYYSGKIARVEDEEFAALLGCGLPEGNWGGLLTENDAICQMYYAKSLAARLIYRVLTRKKEAGEARGKPDLNILFIYNMPFRGIAKMTNGIVSMEMVEGMVEAANGHLVLGVSKIIRGYVRNRKENRLYEERLYGKKEGAGK